jgi:uncharacterized damage-inducible protein DinB
LGTTHFQLTPMENIKWFERKFDFSFTENIFSVILERLAGTPARLEEKFRSILPAQLMQRVGETWTIKENAGHLTDLEPLWQGRLQDIINGEELLRPTDLQNTRTTLANHNSTPTNTLLTSFRQARQETIFLLKDLDESMIFKSALHPRLQQPMRTMDLFLFVADHDDHHLARMTELIKIMDSTN